MKLVVAKDYEEMSALSADIVASIITEAPNATLGLTTGNTPVGLYNKLVARYRSDSLSLDKIRVFCTEEYLGIGPDNPCGLFSWLNRLFVTPCRLSADRVFRLRGDDPEPQLACLEFDEQIRRCGGLDLIVESVGINGHIGFNEPGSPLDAPTRILALSEDTLEYNTSYWDRDVPRYGLTIGLSTILAARQILLLVSGQSKAEALARALTGPVTSAVPASILQQASQLMVVADRDAASLLSGVEV
ncbi:glucosamine-6-phosphate deaminase [Ktedonosporobacter rubrisoli]|uniref:Glucosamine-6-phosphate deaminase n=1 Tax=Ktedonosporobacter rubrisoli TaxID=2509675 RepID=A0A4P6JPR3_KTERU|nr:glucosamine-6-phosphate deaminase [Ktedonosporobacter rubrisoli]QBD77140.1 glucosamine-6-phosphate deaminase [Ktedonosporobacter rubrisoli]